VRRLHRTGFWSSLGVAFVGAGVLVAVGPHLGSRIKFEAKDARRDF
jgi:hypothetical protein